MTVIYVKPQYLKSVAFNYEESRNIEMTLSMQSLGFWSLNPFLFLEETWHSLWIAVCITKTRTQRVKG